MSNFSFPRPVDPTPVQAREPIDGKCNECGAARLMRYPVLSEGGWYMVVKCQECLYSQSREKWTRLGHVTLITDAIE
jgi:ribosomal protein L44E